MKEFTQQTNYYLDDQCIKWQPPFIHPSSHLGSHLGYVIYFVVYFISDDSLLAKILQCGCESDFICSFIEIIKSRGLQYIKFEVVIAQTPVLI